MARKTRIGEKPPMYTFFLNPDPDIRFTTCPSCGQRTGQRKLPLLIHVDPMEFLALNKTCRYSKHCDLLIAHQDEIEGLLAAIFTERNPAVIGNDYLIIGTMERAAWREVMKSQKPFGETLKDVHDFKKTVSFEVQRGWVPAG